MEEAKPVVLTKPVRGREMLSKKGPLDKVAPVGAIEPEKVDKKRVETYYEGYVDGQLFLVPDSNLEAMKDMINFKMRPKTSIRYKHQTSYDIQYYDQFTEKLNELLSKIDDFQESGDFERIKPVESDSAEESLEDLDEEEPEKIESDEQINEFEHVKSEIVEELEKEYVLDDSSSSSSSSHSTEEPVHTFKLSGMFEKPVCISKLSDTLEETIHISKLSDILEKPVCISKVAEKLEDPENKSDELRIRCLISGHFKDGQKPLYIVQEYEGKNDIFKDQKLDFTSSQENSKANIFISGKLYTENILVESEGNPLFLNTKPEKIVISEDKSKMFNNSFEHVFEKEDYLISLQGKFIKGKSGQITPSLSFCVKEKQRA